MVLRYGDPELGYIPRRRIDSLLFDDKDALEPLRHDAQVSLVRVPSIVDVIVTPLEALVAPPCEGGKSVNVPTETDEAGIEKAVLFSGFQPSRKTVSGQSHRVLLHFHEDGFGTAEKISVCVNIGDDINVRTAVEDVLAKK